MKNIAEVMVYYNLSDEEWDAIPTSVQKKIVAKKLVPEKPKKPKSGMKTWEVQYCRIPTNYNTPRLAVVEAATKDDAMAIVHEAFNGGYALNPFDVQNAWEKVETPKPVGKILSL
jgi:hypothetical protein